MDFPWDRLFCCLENTFLIQKGITIMGKIIVTGDRPTGRHKYLYFICLV